MHLASFRSVVAVAIGVAALAGCQSYQSSPLDPEAYESSWRLRTPSDEAVRAFAARLAEEGLTDAPPFDPDDGLSIPEAELVALVFNPDLRLARLRAGVAQATAEHAGRWDDPTFSIDVLRITESVANPWVITPGLAITIPISGRLAAEKARANAAVSVELDRIAEAEWRIRRDVRLTWAEWSAARLKYEELQQFVDSMKSLTESTGQLAETGELPRTEAALFSIEQMQRAYELRRLGGDVAVLEQHLRTLLGLSPEAPIQFTPILSFGVTADSEVGDVASRNLSLARLRQEYEVAEQTLRREIRKQYPDLTIGPLYETDQGQSRIGFLGAIPIPILNANRQGIAEATAEREVARAAFETQLERIIGAIAAMRARATALREGREQITDHLAPLLDRQLDDARRLLEFGESGGLVLLESLVRAHKAKLHLIDVRLDEARAHIELDYLTGPTPAADPKSINPAAESASEVTQ